MATYRVYMLDDDGKIFHGEDIDASDDDAAIAASRTLLENYNANHQVAARGFEVWNGRQIIFSSGSGSD